MKQDITSVKYWDPVKQTATPATVKIATSPGGKAIPSSMKWFTPDGVHEISEPQDLVATPGNGRVDITFTAPLYNGGGSLSGYILKITDSVTGVTTSVTLDATATSYPFTGLTNGDRQNISITATNVNGQVGPAATVSATPTAGPAVKPDACTSVSASAGVKSGTLSWQPPANDGGSALLGYYVQRDAITPAVQVPVTQLSYTWNNLTAGTPVSLSVWPYNSVGNGPVTTKTTTPTSASSSLAAGHVVGTVMLGLVVHEKPPRPASVEADKIVCFNSAGKRVRNFWVQRNYAPGAISKSAITQQTDQGDLYGQYNVISFKYLDSNNVEQWWQFPNGTFDSDLQILVDFAKARRTDATAGIIKELASGIHHEPAGTKMRSGDSLATWAAMHIYCSMFMAGYRRTGPTAPWVYHADQDVSDILAWCPIGNGSWWTQTAANKTTRGQAVPDTLVATLKKNRHIFAADFYEPTANIPNASGYADQGWVPDRSNGKVEDRISFFFSDMKGRPGGCGALGIGEYNSADARDVAASGIHQVYQVCKANVDVAMFAGCFSSRFNSKWEWAAVPKSYPQMKTNVAQFSDYPPGHEVGGTWMTEQRLLSLKKDLDDSRKVAAADQDLTQWTGWAAAN